MPDRVGRNVVRQPITRSGEQTRQPEDAGPLRFAFADPPYPGQSRRHYGSHADYAGEVDHAALIAQLAAFDGWALCSGGAMVVEVGQLCPPGTRVLAWTKPMTPMKAGVSVDFGWEPVFLYGGRRRARRAPLVRDWISCNPARHRGHDHGSEQRDGAVIGMKPQAFCWWIFDALGAKQGDEMVDLFYGSGAVTRAWQAYHAQGRLWTLEPEHEQEELIA